MFLRNVPHFKTLSHFIRYKKNFFPIHARPGPEENSLDWRLWCYSTWRFDQMSKTARDPPRGAFRKIPVPTPTATNVPML